MHSASISLSMASPGRHLYSRRRHLRRPQAWPSPQPSSQPPLASPCTCWKRALEDTCREIRCRRRLSGGMGPWEGSSIPPAARRTPPGGRDRRWMHSCLHAPASNTARCTYCLPHRHSYCMSTFSYLHTFCTMHLGGCHYTHLPKGRTDLPTLPNSAEEIHCTLPLVALAIQNGFV